MHSVVGKSNRFTSVGDYYPLTQFKQLSAKIANQKKKQRNLPKSPREEIYRSLIKDIQNNNNLKIGPLVKKASGILRLSHLKTEPLLNDRKESQKVSSVDLVKPSYPESDSESTTSEASSRSTRDFEEIWDYLDASSKSSDIGSIISRPMSRQTYPSEASSYSIKEISQRKDSKKHEKIPWRYFGNQKGLSPPIPSISSVTHPQYTKSKVSNVGIGIFTSKTNSISHHSHQLIQTNASKPKPIQNQNAIKRSLKQDYLKHVFVIKGQVVTFKGNGFENFTNWFADSSLLRKANKSRFHREVDLSGFSSQEIKFKLYEGYKLVVEACQPIRDNLPPLRFKSTIILPKDIPVENLIMGRNQCGRLIIQETTKPWTA